MGMVTIMSQSLITEDEKKFFDENVRESLDECVIYHDGSIPLTSLCILVLSGLFTEHGLDIRGNLLIEFFEYYKQTSEVYILEVL